MRSQKFRNLPTLKHRIEDELASFLQHSAATYREGIALLGY